MKRAKNLFPQILDRDNLRKAFYLAQRGKRDRGDVQAFAGNLEESLAQLSRDVISGRIPLGTYTQFSIRDPKLRLITAPCFRDRVLHHAMMQVCEPVLDRWLIHDTYACRVGKGRLAAIQRACQFSRRAKYAIKLDMRKYFDSISHANLQVSLRRHFGDARLLDLWDRIIDGHATTSHRGLPIGSLTSQHLANHYLGHFDRWIKEHQRCRFYVRYMDDCVIWDDCRTTLRALAKHSAKFLHDQLDLRLREETPLYRTTCGLDFLGYRVLPTHSVLNLRSRRRFRKKLGDLSQALTHGGISEREYQQRATALTAFTHAGNAKCWKFRRGVLQRLSVDDQEARTV